MRYKKAFDAFIATNPAYQEIRALVAFSGKLTGKEVMHPNDDLLSDDICTVDEDVEFTESNLKPGIGGQDLRIAFDRPEYCVMLVANKFQTGFDQPKLVAMYTDKKIANAVEIVQTLSRLNRTFAGKDQVFIIDFVNDPNSVQAAFAQYDSGAKIEQVQDLNVIYDIKDRLDAEGIYDSGHVLNFMTARYQTAAAFNTGGQTEHKAMFAATQEPMAAIHSDEFKRDAVHITLTSGQTRRQVASDWGSGFPRSACGFGLFRRKPRCLHRMPICFVRMNGCATRTAYSGI